MQPTINNYTKIMLRLINATNIQTSDKSNHSSTYKSNKKQQRQPNTAAV